MISLTSKIPNQTLPQLNRTFFGLYAFFKKEIVILEKKYVHSYSKYSYNIWA